MNDERSESIVQKIAYVEKAHYDLMRVSLASLEGAEIRDLGYAVLISDRVLKIPFTNHASCVNVGEDEADDLIDGVVTYLSQKRRQPHFFISPTTRPADFGERLKAKGFVRLPDDFAWMVYEERHQVDLETNQKVVIDIVDRSVVSTFNRVRTKAFDTPAPIASAFAEAYIKTLSRKAMTHHLAYLDDVAVGTTTLISAKGIGCIYNVGVLEGYRRKGVATALMLRTMAESKDRGDHTLFLSVRKNSQAERLYESLGFHRLFIQVSYQKFRGQWQF